MKKNPQKDQIMEEKAFRHLGEVYVKIPRSIINILFHTDEWQQKTGKLYLYLYCHCSYRQGTYKIGKRIVQCKRGEYVGSYRTLERNTGLSRTTVSRILDQLERQGLISRGLFAGGSRIYLYGYDTYNSTVLKHETSADTSTLRAEGLAEFEKRLEKGHIYG